MKSGVDEDRRLVLCPTLQGWPIDDVIEECPECHDFVLWCCGCHNKRLDEEEKRRTKRQNTGRQVPKTCHHYRLVFTDGACLNNGRPDAKAGAGVAIGNSEEAQLSRPITDEQDAFPQRTSQRAELYAAILGLRFIRDTAELNKKPSGERKEDSKVWIIVTDSEYVVKGMTKWLPKWRRNGWRTSKGTEPLNLDLFLALDKNVKVGFWHVHREYNCIADGLAKSGAAGGDVGSKWVDSDAPPVPVQPFMPVRYMGMDTPEG